MMTNPSSTFKPAYAADRVCANPVFPGEILGEFQILKDVYTALNIQSAYSEWIFVAWIVKVN